MEALVRMLRCSAGASAAEYALLIAIIGGAIAIAGMSLGSAIANSMNAATECIDDPTASSC